MKYVALFEKEKQGFGVTFPDFPGCSTFGEDLNEAVDQAHEALALYVEMYLEEGNELPEATGKKELLALPENKGRKAIFVEVVGDGSDFEEFEVVMHTHLVGRMEKYCREYGISPADFLAVAVRETIKADPFAE
ncbi:type II toxin-antitoxin system HicB family antitoxin [uncultured Pseudodesulfovibrio sp.]|uniref:type II toxin-antitoxin system HicB family antitoxin n=1 Tax=uncultured Pseudodesulfovibrio sp. TaxID=2035858 RepID=UPI0029C724BB|nr:type II toxin-antitoxin system HicB family antitoxin [uncultured Pseudodesulfovibrio sp.]